MKTNKTSKSSNILLWFIAIIVVILGCFCIFIYDPKASIYRCLLKSLAFVSIAIPIIKLIKVYATCLVNYIFCVPNTWWIKEIQRPRLSFNVTGVTFIFLSLDTLGSINSETELFGLILNSILTIILYILGLIIITVSWTKRFETFLIPKIKEKLEENYKIESCVPLLKKQEVEDFLKRDKIKGSEETLKIFINYRGNYSELINVFNFKESEKLEWIFLSGLNNNQIFNSQTLITLISFVYGTEDSSTIRLLAKIFFKEEYSISSKNITTWKKNESVYLITFENELESLLRDSKP